MGHYKELHGSLYFSRKKNKEPNERWCVLVYPLPEWGLVTCLYTSLFIFYTADNEEVAKMRYYYTGYSCCGWIPAEDGSGKWMYFATVEEYKEAYAEALCP